MLTLLWLAVPLAVAGVDEGQVLFEHAWTPDDPMSAAGDGLGPLYNATSCAECHNQGGSGGAGGSDHDVLLLPVQGMVPHFGTSPAYDEHRSGQFRPSHVPEFHCGTAFMEFMSQFESVRRQTPALFGIGQLDGVSEDALDAARTAGEAQGMSGRIARDADGRPGRLGWKGQMTSVDAFVEAACANELGLGTPNVPQLRDPTRPDTARVGPDLDAGQVASLAAFVSSLPPPPTPDSTTRATAGRATFEATGCTGCHVEQIGSVNGAWTDLLLHDLGFELADGSAGYGVPQVTELASAAQASEWRTPPLWGVGSTSPYLHDGRARTLDQAIRLHGGEADEVRERYAALSRGQRGELLAFLSSL